MKKRRARTDSAAGALEAVQAADIVVPAHLSLRECDQPYWDSIIAARSADSWNAVDLEQAVILARCKANIDIVQNELDAEGYTVEEDGKVKKNPKHEVVETLSRRVIRLSAALHINAAATQGRARDTGQRTKVQNETRAKAYSENDGLIARPLTRVK